MVKFGVKLDDNKKLVGFGITRHNIELLMKGQPIKAKLADMVGMGLDDVEVLIFYGETERAIARDMQEMIGEDTIVIDRLKGVNN